MCIADLYDVNPKRREKLACLESMIRMRDAVREVDAINRSMPAVTAYTPSHPPRVEAVAADAYQSLEKAA